jgi:hypothetical protein
MSEGQNFGIRHLGTRSLMRVHHWVARGMGCWRTHSHRGRGRSLVGAVHCLRRAIRLLSAHHGLRGALRLLRVNHWLSKAPKLLGEHHHLRLGRVHHHLGGARSLRRVHNHPGRARSLIVLNHGRREGTTRHQSAIVATKPSDFVARCDWELT